MDVVGALVGEDRLKIVHVAADGVLQRNAVGAEDRARFTRSFERLAHVVALRKGNLYRVQQSFILQPPKV